MTGRFMTGRLRPVQMAVPAAAHLLSNKYHTGILQTARRHFTTPI
jgi:hypothetical protein